MVKPTDQEMTATEKAVPKKWHAMPSRATWESTSVRRQNKQGESMDDNLYCGFPEKGKVREGKQA